MANETAPTDHLNTVTPQLRSSCDACNAAKVKCSKDRPQCRRCETRELPCLYGISMRSAMGRSFRSNNEAQAMAWYGRPNVVARPGRPTGLYHSRDHRSSTPSTSVSRSYLSASLCSAAPSPMSTPPMPVDAFPSAVHDSCNSIKPPIDPLQPSDPDSNNSMPFGYLPQSFGIQDEAPQSCDEGLCPGDFNFGFPVPQQSLDGQPAFSFETFSSASQINQRHSGFTTCLCQQKIHWWSYELSTSLSESQLPPEKVAGIVESIVETCRSAIDCPQHRNSHDHLTFYLSFISLLLQAINISDTAALRPTARRLSYSNRGSVSSAMDGGDYFDASSVGIADAPLTPRSIHATSPPSAGTFTLPHTFAPGPHALSSCASDGHSTRAVHWGVLRMGRSKMGEIIQELERRFVQEQLPFNRDIFINLRRRLGRA